MTNEQAERLKQELRRRLTIARGIEIESGSAKDRAFVDGGIAAFELLLDDLSLLDSDSQAVAGDADTPSECFDRGYLGGSLQGHADGYELGYHDAATLMRDKCVDAIKSLRATPHGAAYSNAINDAISKIESLTLDQVKPGEM